MRAKKPSYVSGKTYRSDEIALVPKDNDSYRSSKMKMYTLMISKTLSGYDILYFGVMGSPPPP